MERERISKKARTSFLEYNPSFFYVQQIFETHITHERESEKGEDRKSEGDV